MYEWATNPELGAINKNLAICLTDDDGEVSVDDVSTAVELLIEAAVDQIVLYFSGHGAYVRGGATWFLSRAGERSYDAISVVSTVQLASWGKTPHVVIISDACQLPGQDALSQWIEGVAVFPLSDVRNPPMLVDEFHATTAGQAAGEIAMKGGGIYTDVLLGALSGEAVELLEGGNRGDGARYIYAAQLAKYLREEVGLRIQQLPAGTLRQEPADSIRSGPPRWIGRVSDQWCRDEPEAGSTSPPVVEIDDARGPTFKSWAERLPVDGNKPSNERARRRPQKRSGTTASREPAPITLWQVSDALIASVINDDNSLGKALEFARSADVDGAKALARSVDELLTPLPALTMSTGVRVHNATLEDAFGPTVESFGSDHVVCEASEDEPALVALTFGDGSGTVIPCLTGFIAEVTQRQGELVHIGYEPSPSNEDVMLSDDRLQELRQLRAVAASSAQYNRFRLTADQARALVGRMQAAKGIDPTMAIYAAYASYDRQDIGRIQEIYEHLPTAMNGVLYDVALLSGYLSPGHEVPLHRVVPFAPMRSQGWDLLSGYRVNHHDFLRKLKRTMRESLWTLFEPAGMDLIRDCDEPCLKQLHDQR
jgi:Caspase domain